MPQENVLARYSILHELGRGAIGRVYAARDRETGAVVALKRFDPALLAKLGASSAERLLKQARSARFLKHSNIVAVHDAGEVGGTLYVAMEMLEGESLRKMLDDGPLPIGRALRIAHDIATGLAYAHLEGAVHGGLKASNVIVLRSGVAKITDFGTAQPAQPSPEQMRGDPVDHRSDIFSLGALLYEMLTHRPPVDATAPPPSELNPHVPRALDTVVLSMLARQSGSRMPGVPILLRELDRLEEGLGLSAAPRAAAGEPTASVPPAEPVSRPRAPDPARITDRVPVRDAPRADPTSDRELFDYHPAMAMMDRESRQERCAGSRRTISASVIAVLALLGTGVAGFMYSFSWPGEPGIRDALARLVPSSLTQRTLATAHEPSRQVAPLPVAATTKEPEAPASAPEPPREVAPLPVGDATPEAVPARPPEDPMPAGPQVAEPPPLAQPAPTESSVVRASEQPEPAQAPPVQKPARTAQATTKAPQRQPGGTARLILAVSPQGEIYIDGKHHGTTPPVTAFDLEPGMHRVEVRSGSRTPYLTYMTVEAGEVRRIRHDFDTSRAVYPGKGISRRHAATAARSNIPGR